MAITIENIANSQTNKVKTWCPECAKTLWLEDYDLEPFAPGIIDLMESRANQHVRKHPKHNPSVLIYRRLPTPKEIRET